MESNWICGIVLSKDVAQHYLDLSLSIHHAISFALDSNKMYNYANHAKTAWSIATSKNPEPLDVAILMAKRIIDSSHVSFYEEWKGIKYGEYLAKWPESLHRDSLWTSFARAMDQAHPIYELRNWFSHSFGRRTTTLETEQEHFKMLIQGYEDFLPVLEELIKKLEETLEDELAWAPSHEVRARLHDAEQPEYARDCEAVQLELKERAEKLAARVRQAEKARLAQEELEKENPWGWDDWVQTDDVEEEWVQTDDIEKDWVHTEDQSDEGEQDTEDLLDFECSTTLNEPIRIPKLRIEFTDLPHGALNHLNAHVTMQSHAGSLLEFSFSGTELAPNVSGLGKDLVEVLTKGMGEL